MDAHIEPHTRSDFSSRSKIGPLLYVTLHLTFKLKKNKKNLSSYFFARVSIVHALKCAFRVVGLKLLPVESQGW